MTIPLKVRSWVNYSETLKAVLQWTVYGTNHFWLAIINTCVVQSWLAIYGKPTSVPEHLCVLGSDKVILFQVFLNLTLREEGG